LVSKIGNTMINQIPYQGVLFENLVASSFFNLRIHGDISFNTYYDDNKKKNVDFIIQQEFNRPIPVEVSVGKKDKKQVLNAINRYNSDYGIIISNTTQSIKKENEIIYLPLKTFSFL
jgi:predicted AAA+ superfamily ATPase